ncbi:hypothetical protein [Chthonobacter rhizosphaerae]|uniref:hypothetical protein n=1 Tax=Chthonobacter rhizosphaerae TaxID=2735553 RepID=UPI0015EF61B4|nr:hypothetical protein [Chthonobacter rhizosphaerae]
MATADDKPDDKIIPLDPRQAELGEGLRRLYRPLIEERVPEEIMALSHTLEAKLAAADRCRANDGERAASSGAPQASGGTRAPGDGRPSDD